MNKKNARIRRSRRTKFRIKKLNQVRLCVNRTPRHIYAQVISGCGSNILAQASTLDSEVKAEINGYAGNIDAAAIVGKFIATRSLAKDITKVAFDRSGFKYHGRVKALADSAREHGLEF